MKIRVYYDGSCHLCSREIGNYKKHKKSKERIQFVDIADPCFEWEKEGPSKEAFEKAMHVKLGDGSFVTGVEAFVAIWTELETFWFLTFLARKPFFRFFMDLGYKIFAKLRVYLPKRKVDCHNGNCDR